MSIGLFYYKVRLFFNLLFLVVALCFTAGCNITKHVDPGQSLLVRNKIVLKSTGKINNKGELKDNLIRLSIQRPNKFNAGIFPFRLALYNKRYRKLHDRPDTSLPKSVERPVIFDTSLILRSTQNMKSYLFNQGYFYARIKDTFVIKNKKAYNTFIINAGKNYLINKINFDVDDSVILGLLRANAGETRLPRQKPFTYSMLEEERSRITSVIRDNGFYRFSQENITFKLDTVDKTMFRHVESPFENAISYIATSQSHKKPTIDINVIIRLADDSAAYRQYMIREVNVYPDYNNREDLTDSSLIKKTLDSINFKYHQEYVRPRVLYEHIYLNPNALYSQSDYNKTYSKLNELGIFQYIRINVRENRQTRGTLISDIYLNRAKKHDFSTNYEISSGTTYDLGNSIGINYRDRNFLKGANVLTLGVNGGIEWAYNKLSGDNFVRHFNLLTLYYGANASVDFPKFLAPIASSLFDNSNLPHTIIGGGENVIDRVLYYTLVNTSANFSYNWRQTQTKSWTLSPGFINIIRLPLQTDSFKKVLDSNLYLKNSYKETFIEGENISFTFDNAQKKHGINQSYLKLAFEEAGGLLQVVNKLGVALNDLYKINFSQYTKFDFDAHQYFTFPHSVFAIRLYGGIGLPYGQSDVLPYVKQYYAGGPYSLRGWRIRTLGPGSYFQNIRNANLIDRTGDIKLEFNSEYRFPVSPLFAGLVKMNGALFMDAGNIWLTKKNIGYPGGEIELATLGQDIATDIGAGARFDIVSFLTLRLDVAVPVKKPYVPENNGWVFHQIDFGNSSWRSNNVTVNISLGYPF